jgi:hypothetical protein
MSIIVEAGRAYQIIVQLEPIGLNAEVWGYVTDNNPTNPQAIGGALVQLLGTVNSYSVYSGAADGFFAITPIVPDTYTIIVSKDGFKTYKG